MIERLQEKKMKISFVKSQLVIQQIEFLRNYIERDVIKAHPKLAKCLKVVKRPETYDELQRLLETNNYSSAFIPNNAGITIPLYNLMDILYPKMYKNIPTI